MTNPFEKLRLSGASQEKSFQWFQAQVKKLGTINTNELMREGVLVNQILPGTMYIFKYDAKLKEKLPYFDMLPLVLPFRKVPGGFYGLNLHYLPHLLRYRVLGYLSEYSSDTAIDENTRISISWRILESSAKLAPIKPCVKHYLNDHVQSRFLKIPYTDWITASQLPIEKFEGADKSTVWRDSRKKF